MTDQGTTHSFDDASKVSLEAADLTEPLTIPVIQEQVRIERETVETGRVSVQKRVHQETQTLELPTLHQRIDIERVPINRVVEQAPETRYEGDTLIIPVVREEVISLTRLVLTEEIHLKNSYRTETDHQSVTLRREEVIINRQAPDQP